MRLDPVPNNAFLYNLGTILYFTGRPEEAIPPLKKACERTYWTPALVFLAASYAAAGRMEEAKRQAAYSRASAESILNRLRPYKNPADVRRVLDDLAKAGAE